MKFSKKITAIFIAVMMVVSAIPFTAFAAPPGSSEIGTGTGGISIGGGSTVVGGDSYLTFTGTDSFSIKTNNSMKNWDGTLEYSTDANTWTKWNGASQISSDNNVLYLRGTGNTKISGSSSKNWVITTQGTVACSGDIRTLLDYTEPESSSMVNRCFCCLFYNCTSLTAAPALPATILADNCYNNMFYGCESLTTAPALPATTLAEQCYYNMFVGCRSLTTAPELPATTLAQYCYFNMFNGCTSLTTAPELPATMLATYCYYSMFRGCRSLTTAPELWATTMASNCYDSMFNGCTSLTTAPELPATSLASNCYNSMFNGCESLTTAPALPATTLASNCYCNMFNGCTSLTTAPALPATELADFCYNSMFQGCTGIKLSTEQTAEYSIPYSIPKEGTGTEGNNSLTNMFTGTGGTFTGTPTINTTYYIPGSAPTEPNNGASITVAETISENFYLDDEFYGETAYVSFTYNHNSDISETADISTNVMAMSSLDDATDGRKKFSVVQAPAQATEPITIKVYANAEDAQAGENAIDTIDYSVYNYCRDIIENYDGEKADEMKALAKSTLDYAAAAQTYFGYNTENMATKDAQGDFYNEVASADLSNVAGVSSAPSSIKKASMVVKSDLEINLLSTEPISVTNASIDATKGTDRFDVTTYQNGDYYVVHIAGIEPANMGKVITIYTAQGNIVMTANSVVKMFANSNNANLSTLAKALFLYGNAANEYFG